MTDDSAAPPAPDAGLPAKPAGPRTMRPPPRKGPAPAPSGPSKVKAYLVIGIIVATIVLLGLIAWRLYVKLSAKSAGPSRNVGAEFNDAWDQSRKAQDDLFKIQARVWIENKELTPADLDKVKAALATYRKTSDAFHELNSVMQKAGKTNSKEFQDIGDRLILLKTWIWDANGVVDPASKPPNYGGLYIPMYQAEKRFEETAKRLKEIREKAQEINQRRNLDEIKETVKEVRSLRERFAAIRDELLALDDELLKGLTLPDLKENQLPDLRDLRTLTSKAIMAFKEAGNVRADFPSDEDLNAPPKEEAPKQEPPKEEPPKQDPPKEEPPKETPK